LRAYQTNGISAWFDYTYSFHVLQGDTAENME